MNEPGEGAETPPDEGPEPVVDVGSGEETPPRNADAPERPDQTETAEAKEEGPQEPRSKLEDADPEPDSVDDEAAKDDRDRGIRNLSVMTGDRARQYQAEQISIFGGEVAALPRHGPIPSWTLRRLRDAYVWAGSGKQLLDALLVSPVQCLVGPPGTGRTTTAIAVAGGHLQRAGVPVDGNVHILATERGLPAIDESSIPERKALILTLSVDAPAPDLSWFGGIGKSLITQHSILIVVAATEPVGSGALTTGWAVRHTPPPSDEVFLRHLEQRFPARAQQLSAVPAVATSVRRCATPRDAANLAAEVIADVAGGVPDAKLLSEPASHLETARKELQERELWHRILLVASAVMADLAAGTVTREAMRLAELHKPTALQTEVPKIEWFTSAASWSGSVELLGDEAGDGAGQIVRLTHPKLAIPLLRTVWEEHVGERDVLLPWLCGLGAHPQKRVRVKAAQTVAQLACYDFDIVVREVIQVWALDGRFRTRETCATALEALALAADGRFAKRVRGQVQNWAGGSNVQLNAAAVAAYGTFLGAKDPDEAVARMGNIVGGRILRRDGRRDPSIERVERELANIVQRALVDVFKAGAQEKVVHTLAEWAGRRHWRWRQAAARTLLDLAGMRGSGAWPLLVELATVQERTYAAVLALWLNRLDAAHRDEAGWDALHRWLDQARDLRGDESAAAVVKVVDRLVADLRAAGPEIADNIVFHERVWAFRARRTGPDSSTHHLPEENTP